MAKLRSFLKSVSLLGFIYLSLCFSTGYSNDENREKKHGPNLAERAIGITQYPWNKLKSWAFLAWTQMTTPESKASVKDSAIKEAASKSFQTSKTTAEHVAKTAGEAVQKTMEKVKMSISDKQSNSDDDL